METSIRDVKQLNTLKKNNMEVELIFKTKRQEKDFDTIWKNIYFEGKDTRQNSIKDILINLSHLTEKEEKQAINFINNLKSKNIMYNSKRKILSIS